MKMKGILEVDADFVKKKSVEVEVVKEVEEIRRICSRVGPTDLQWLPKLRLHFYHSLLETASSVPIRIADTSHLQQRRSYATIPRPE